MFNTSDSDPHRGEKVIVTTNSTTTSGVIDRSVNITNDWIIKGIYPPKTNNESEASRRPPQQSPKKKSDK